MKVDLFNIRSIVPFPMSIHVNYLSLDVMLNEYFMFKLATENIYYDGSSDQILKFNISVTKLSQDESLQTLLHDVYRGFFSSPVTAKLSMVNFVVSSSPSAASYLFLSLVRFEFIISEEFKTFNLFKPNSTLDNLEKDVIEVIQLQQNGMSIATTHTGFLISLDLTIINLSPISINFGFMSLSLGLADGTTEIIKVKTQNFVLDRKSAKMLISLDASVGKGEILARGIQKYSKDYLDEIEAYVTLKSIQFGTDSSDTVNLLQKVVFNSNLYS